jgi:hypothetical protein
MSPADRSEPSGQVASRELLSERVLLLELKSVSFANGDFKKSRGFTPAAARLNTAVSRVGFGSGSFGCIRCPRDVRFPSDRAETSLRDHL